MGVFEGSVAIAGAISSMIGLWFFIDKKMKNKRIQEKAKKEAELAIAIQKAQTDEDRKKHAEELSRIRSSN